MDEVERFREKNTTSPEKTLAVRELRLPRNTSGLDGGGGAGGWHNYVRILLMLALGLIISVALYFILS